MRALGARWASARQPSSPAQPHAHGLLAPRVARHRPRPAARVILRGRGVRALERAQGRPREQLEGDHRRHRVARQAERERSVAHAEPGGLARASGARPRSAPPRRASRSAPLHVVVRAHRHAARDAHHVGARERALERRARALGGVGRARARDQLRARARDLGGQGEARWSCRCGRAPSGSPGCTSSSPVTTQRHARAARRSAARARPSEAATPSSAGPSGVPARSTDVAGAHVLARAGGCSRPARVSGTRTRSPSVLGALHGHHGVGALGHRRAGGDAHGRARLEHARRTGGPARDSPTTCSSAAGPATSAKPSIAELSKGGTSPGAGQRPRPARGPSASLERHGLGAERPDLRQHPPRAPRRSRSGCSWRQSFQGRAFARGAVLCKFRPGSAVFGGRIVLPPRTSGKRTDSRPMTPIRGPLARVDRSREELAKAWLVRLIERASLEEIRDLPTERIARELPELISDILRVGGRQRHRPVQARRRAGERAASLAALAGGRDASVAEVARDVASLQAVLVRGAAGGARRERPGAVRRRRGAPGGRHGAIQAAVTEELVRSRSRELESQAQHRRRSPASATSATSSARSRTCSTSTSATGTPSACC